MIGGFGVQARIPELGLGLEPLGNVAALALHFRRRPIAAGNPVLLPFEPARPARRVNLLHVALAEEGSSGYQRSCPLARQHAGRKGPPERRAVAKRKYAAKGAIDEREAALRVATHNDVGLIVQ